MKRLQWFRCWSEIIDDEKLRLLAFEDRWHFIALLACKAQGILDGNDHDQIMRRKIAVKLGLQVRELEEVARRLAEVDLICFETLEPLAWESRQFQSDVSTDRVRRFRERNVSETDTKRFTNVSETDTKRFRNVSETPPETESESETEAEAETEADLSSESTEKVNMHCRAKAPTTRVSRVSPAEIDQVINHLNRRAGTKFRRINGNGKPSKNSELVAARIGEHGVPALLEVIDRKVDQWLHNDEMRQYLRPGTLFRREKCEQYVGEAKAYRPGSFLEDDDAIEVPWRRES